MTPGKILKKSYKLHHSCGPQQLSQDRFAFRVWAPRSKSPILEILTPHSRKIPMEPLGQGYWQAVVNEPVPGTQYLYQILENVSRPDPASHHQPLGVHGPSALVIHEDFKWTDHVYQPPDISSLVFYEIHVGTFTEAGTFAAVVERLEYLANLGITALEIMPVAQCPGNRNWGYDGVYLFAVQDSYGGPDGLKTLVDACHARGIAVFLDVVYNHLGPEGNYLNEFGPYFTSRYKTPWGQAINLDGPKSDHVRKFFLENTRYWFKHYHIDGLRLDATQFIHDKREDPFLKELSRTADEISKTTGKRRFLVAENNLNDPTLIRPQNSGGMGLDAVWSDDFHHSTHALLTGERQGYYKDYSEPEYLAKALAHGFAYQGEYSRFYARSHGNNTQGLPGSSFVIYTQNHDQIGNRCMGERLSQLVCFERLKLAAALMLFSPYLPLLFMGEEYGEESPFLYFIDHADPRLIDSVRKGRKREFNKFLWNNNPPDPKNPKTFQLSKIRWERRHQPSGEKLLSFYQACLHLRRSLPALAAMDKDKTRVQLSGHLLSLHRNLDKEEILALYNLAKPSTDISQLDKLGEGWERILDSTDMAFSLSEKKDIKEGLLPGYAIHLYYRKNIDPITAPSESGER